jgi:uncharacterized protein (DUF1684 family)
MTYVAEIERWHARRLTRLTGPDGWLSLVGLEWLSEGDNAVVLPGRQAPVQVGTITVEGGRAFLRADPGAGVTHEGRPVDELAMQDDGGGSPTVLHLGSLSFHLINREGRLAVRVRDAEAHARRSFSGIERYPVDPSWRIEARFDPFDPPPEVTVPSVLAFEQTMVVLGALDFVIGRASCRLVAFHEAGTDDLYIVFGDGTNADATYQGGRYLYARPADDLGITLVDFNKAYNPPCAFTTYATCVLPTPENRLPIRIEAGEKRYRG